MFVTSAGEDLEDSDYAPRNKRCEFSSEEEEDAAKPKKASSKEVRTKAEQIAIDVLLKSMRQAPASKTVAPKAAAPQVADPQAAAPQAAAPRAAAQKANQKIKSLGEIYEGGEASKEGRGIGAKGLRNDRV